MEHKYIRVGTLTNVMFVYSHRVESQMCCFIICCSNGDGRCSDNMICFFSFGCKYLGTL